MHGRPTSADSLSAVSRAILKDVTDKAEAMLSDTFDCMIWGLPPNQMLLVKVDRRELARFMAVSVLGAVDEIRRADRDPA